MIEILPCLADPPDENSDSDSKTDASRHPLRTLTRQLAFQGGWNPQLRLQFQSTFDELAPTWPTDNWLNLTTQLSDALNRGIARSKLRINKGETARALDLGGGNGRAASLITEHFGKAIIVDISYEMLSRVPNEIANCIHADAACMPVPDGSIDLVVAANMFMFPKEINRILSDHGAFVWINSMGPRAPIYLSPHEVDSALPGSWWGVTSTVQGANWSVHWRNIPT